METTRILTVVALAVVAVGVIGLAISCHIGKLMTRIRPCGGGRHNAKQ